MKKQITLITVLGNINKSVSSQTILPDTHLTSLKQESSPSLSRSGRLFAIQAGRVCYSCKTQPRSYSEQSASYSEQSASYSEQSAHLPSHKQFYLNRKFRFYKLSFSYLCPRVFAVCRFSDLFPLPFY